MKIRKIRVGRRSFIKLLSALGLATASKSISAQTATPSPTPSPSPTPALRITKEMMHDAEKLIGIELNDAQEAMALGGVNRNLDAYETVRKIDVPLDTEPEKPRASPVSGLLFEPVPSFNVYISAWVMQGNDTRFVGEQL